MKLSEILAISGQPGLYKYVAQARNGIIVESLSDSKRSSVAGSAKVSSLSDIAIFTQTEDVALAQVFEMIYKENGGKEAISHKSTPEQIKSELKRYMPDFDEDRVHLSDMKKIFSWYNILTSAGMTSFVESEEPETTQEATATSASSLDATTEEAAPKKGAKKATTASAAAAKKPVAKKAEAKNVGKISGAKTVKTKTAPKAK